MSPKRALPKKIAVLNFGGIGDEILFSPVLDTLKRALPDAKVTLILEKRSAGISALLPRMNYDNPDAKAQDGVISLDLHEYSRKQLFFKLRDILRGGNFDAVLSSGSSPFISAMLFSTGISYRVGYASSPIAPLLLSCAAPLKTRQYASAMYFSLAQSFLEGLFHPAEIHQLGLPLHPAPVLAPPHIGHLSWAREALGKLPRRGAARQRTVLIHPGVSLMSIEKNILKSWPAKYWASFVQTLCPQYPDTSFVLLGGPDDEAVVGAIRDALEEKHPDKPLMEDRWPRNFYDWYGKTRSLEQLAALIHEADMLISADSAPLHLAVGYQKPVLAMFGPTDEKKLLPKSELYRAVTVEGLSCRPCLWDHRATSCGRPVCLDVPTEAMIAEFKGVFARF